MPTLKQAKETKSDLENKIHETKARLAETEKRMDQINSEIMELYKAELNGENVDIEVNKLKSEKMKLSQDIPIKKRLLDALEAELHASEEELKELRQKENRKEYNKMARKRQKLNKQLEKNVDDMIETIRELKELEPQMVTLGKNMGFTPKVRDHIITNYLEHRLSAYLSTPYVPHALRKPLNDLDILARER